MEARGALAGRTAPGVGGAHGPSCEPLEVRGVGRSGVNVNTGYNVLNVRTTLSLISPNYWTGTLFVDTGIRSHWMRVEAEPARISNDSAIARSLRQMYWPSAHVHRGHARQSVVPWNDRHNDQLRAEPVCGAGSLPGARQPLAKRSPMSTNLLDAMVFGVPDPARFPRHLSVIPA